MTRRVTKHWWLQPSRGREAEAGCGRLREESCQNRSTHPCRKLCQHLFRRQSQPLFLRGGPGRAPQGHGADLLTNGRPRQILNMPGGVALATNSHTSRPRSLQAAEAEQPPNLVAVLLLLSREPGIPP